MSVSPFFMLPSNNTSILSRFLPADKTYLTNLRATWTSEIDKKELNDLVEVVTTMRLRGSQLPRGPITLPVLEAELLNYGIRGGLSIRSADVVFYEDKYDGIIDMNTGGALPQLSFVSKTYIKSVLHDLFKVYLPRRRHLEIWEMVKEVYKEDPEFEKRKRLTILQSREPINQKILDEFNGFLDANLGLLVMPFDRRMFVSDFR